MRPVFTGIVTEVNQPAEMAGFFTTREFHIGVIIPDSCRAQAVQLTSPERMSSHLRDCGTAASFV